MVGGATSGYCETDSHDRATAPARVTNTDSTVAKIGRSMKNRGIIQLSSAVDGWRAGRLGCRDHCGAWRAGRVSQGFVGWAPPTTTYAHGGRCPPYKPPVRGLVLNPNGLSLPP